MRNETSVGAGSLLSSAAEVKNKKQKSSGTPNGPGTPAAPPRPPLPPRAVPGSTRVPPPLPPRQPELGGSENPRLPIPDRSMLGAMVLDETYQRACVLPIYSAASILEGVHQLIGHQPDLREFAAALALIVEGERELAKLREHLAGTDADFEAAFEAPFVAAVSLLGGQVRRMVQLVPELAEYADAQERIERGAATMTALSAFLAAL